MYMCGFVQLVYVWLGVRVIHQVSQVRADVLLKSWHSPKLSIQKVIVNNELKQSQLHTYYTLYMA